jgi:hypothetical protein
VYVVAQRNSGNSKASLLAISARDMRLEGVELISLRHSRSDNQLKHAYITSKSIPKVLTQFPNKQKKERKDITLLC